MVELTTYVIWFSYVDVNALIDTAWDLKLGDIRSVWEPDTIIYRKWKCPKSKYGIGEGVLYRGEIIASLTVTADNGLYFYR